MTDQLRILLLEDDEDDYLITKQLLHGAYPGGVDLTWADHYERGMELVLGSQFDVCLIDYRLGEKNGINWLAELTDQIDGRAPPTILLTGAGGKEADLLASKAGFSDFISKAGLTSALLERAIRYAQSHKRLITQLDASRDNYRQLYNSAFEGILLISMDGVILDCNASGEALFGYSHAEMIGKPILCLIPERFRHKHTTGMHAVVDEGAGCVSGKVVEVPALCSNGSEILIQMMTNVIEAAGQMCFSANLIDITERKKLEEALRVQANNDPLTGMYNRRYFLNRAEDEWKRARRFAHHLSVLMLDIDHFKDVNDSHGHAAGDEVLKMVAQTLTGVVRSIDIAARWGGEEFIVLLPETDGEGEMVIADKIRQHIASCSTPCGDKAIEVTVSIGIMLKSMAEIGSVDCNGGLLMTMEMIPPD